MATGQRRARSSFAFGGGQRPGREIRSGVNVDRFRTLAGEGHGSARFGAHLGP